MNENGLPATLQWMGQQDGFLRLLDQTRLPQTEVFLDCHTVAEVVDAIRRLVVRGAPAIGLAAAYGVLLGVADAVKKGTDPIVAVRSSIDQLAASRPTAVNLFWALEKMRAAAVAVSPVELPEHLLRVANQLHAADRETCRQIGQHGLTLLKTCTGVLTHCNAGALAASAHGTALAAIYAAAKLNPDLRVYADETRPLLQGARLTAWELHRSGVNTCVICDNMAAALMQAGKIDAVIVGADRIAGNGDTANKIGTYGLAIIASYHAVPFYVAAPFSTFDLQLRDGRQIPIEQRAAAEVTHPAGVAMVTEGVAVENPAFDVTPADLITAIVTERGIIRPVDQQHIEAMAP